MTVLVKIWQEEIEDARQRIARLLKLKSGLEDSLTFETRVEERIRMEKIIKRHKETMEL